MTEWYYQAMGNVVGPVSFEELRRMADTGEIAEQTAVRAGADGPWQAASQVEGLFDVIPSGANIEEQVDAEPVAADKVDEQEHLVRRQPLTLRPCADCGTMVSRHARACPECGRPFHEPSFQVPYAGEHPVPVWVFFTVLAVAFILVSPVVVYRVAQSVAARTPEGDEVSGQLALLVGAGYLLSTIVCAALGAAVGAPRMAYYTGLLLGLFFGPLGVFAAFAIDKRPHCPNCFERLNGIARECPSCHSGLTWVLARRWY